MAAIGLLLTLGRLHANNPWFHLAIDLCGDDQRWVVREVGQTSKTALLLGAEGRPLVVLEELVFVRSKFLQFGSCSHIELESGSAACYSPAAESGVDA